MYEDFPLTPKEAASFIGCSEYTIKEYARNRVIPSYRVGNRIKFRAGDLVKWLNEQKENCEDED